MGKASVQGLVVLFGFLAAQMDARHDVVFAGAGAAGKGWVAMRVVAKVQEKLTGSPV